MVGERKKIRKERGDAPRAGKGVEREIERKGERAKGG